MDVDWRTGVAADWAEALAPAGPALDAALASLDGSEFLPPRAQVLRAFAAPLADVRVLLVGQDPYPTPGDAVGLSFSVAPGRPMPRSLRNIAAELAADTGEELGSGDLSGWASQGVLLLNRVLTVAPGEAGSHRGRGWEQVTARAIEALAARGGPLVAVLWGREAQSLAPLLGDVPVIASAHPSPLSARRGFFGSRPFSRVNALLEEQGAAPIRWSTEPDVGLSAGPPAALF
ncbi:uracil-DNA glycosylase [Demequina silvatica]|uniref:uracil-DNA glycosylase n=1 Tax=Demequina silvatica TaxID=1638988 RepID=UPI000780E9E6|nr:uracil-DNA glycosylase [Demequina silvatica]